MGTPNRTSILLNVKTTLEGITVIGGYNTTVLTAEPYLRGREEVKPGEMPYLGFGFDPESYEHHPSSKMRVKVPLTIVGYTQTRGWAARSAALNLLLDDVIKAMFTDTTRGGYAIMTTLRETQTDEHDPDVDSHGEGKGMAYATFDIVYERDIGAS